MRRLIAIALMSACALAAQAQGSDFSKIEIQTQKLTDNGYMLVGAGGNIGVSVGEDAVFLIDDQFAPMAPITTKPVQFLLNTHFHFDHTGGNEAFGSEGALIVAHDNVRRRMSSPQLITPLGNTSPQPSSPKAALPVVTVAPEVTFHINGDEVHAFDVPRARTDVELIVHFRKADLQACRDMLATGTQRIKDLRRKGQTDTQIRDAIPR